MPPPPLPLPTPTRPPYPPAPPHPTPPACRRLAALAVGMVFPVLESFRAIESKGEGDDKQW